ncbi:MULTISPECIES: hypothetical protein [unclassified Variovorax]|uniref:hypothetical protein n=1 Tax=unclassified Variovorax TaxID=663243 RepID=UPI003F467C0D
MKTRERLVFFYDLTISSKSKNAAISRPSCVSFKEAIEAINKGKPTGISLHRRSNELIEITDWRYDSASHTYQILVNRADLSIADPAFKHFKTKAVRPGGKTKEEGIDVSTHIVVRVDNNSQTALVMVTYGAGITASIIEKLFKQLMKAVKTVKRHAALFHFAEPGGSIGKDGNPVTYEVDYEFSAAGHQSQTLKDDINAGRFISMDLITDISEKFDNSGNLQVKKQVLKIKPFDASKVSLAGLVNAVKEARKTKVLHAARIRFKDSDGKPREEQFSIDALEKSFTRKQHVSFDSDLPSQSTKIDKTIIDGMLELI